MSAPAFFITGTDTDAGKTFAACAVLAAAREQGWTTAALKPVAAGVNTDGVNADVVLLSRQCTIALSPAEINPHCFAEPIAPHIAAARAGVSMGAAALAERCRPVLSRAADLTLVEGAGGWKVPLNDSETLADLVRALQIPVILVVGMRLGCLNHALLTAQAITADGARLAGWIANRVDPDMMYYPENLATLQSRLPAPLLGEIPWQGDLEWADGVTIESLRTL